MSEDDAFEFKDYGLEELMDLIENKSNLIIKVGILGDKGARDGDNSNADIGAKHEFGVGVPKRSFLRAPLIEKMQESFEESGALSDSAIRGVFREGPTLWYKKIGAMAEAIVADAFHTGGFGKWKASDMKHKKNKQTLVETQQLRNSITSIVEENSGE